MPKTQQNLQKNSTSKKNREKLMILRNKKKMKKEKLKKLLKQKKMLLKKSKSKLKSCTKRVLKKFVELCINKMPKTKYDKFYCYETAKKY